MTLSLSTEWQTRQNPNPNVPKYCYHWDCLIFSMFQVPWTAIRHTWYVTFSIWNRKWEGISPFLKRRQYYFIISNRKQIRNLSYPDEQLSLRSRRRGRRAHCQGGSITVAVSHRAHSESVSSCIYFEAFAVTSSGFTSSRGWRQSCVQILNFLWGLDKVF